MFIQCNSNWHATTNLVPADTINLSTRVVNQIDDGKESSHKQINYDRAWWIKSQMVAREFSISIAGNTQELKKICQFIELETIDLYSLFLAHNRKTQKLQFTL